MFHRPKKQPRVKPHQSLETNCGREMKIVAFIEEKAVVEKNLRPCDLWKDHKPRPPPASSMLLNLLPPVPVNRAILDCNYFEQNCA